MASLTTQQMPACVTVDQECPACDAPWYDGSFATVTDRYGWTWGLMSCGKCGVQFQRWPMTPDARMAFYASGQYRMLCAQVTGQPWDDPVYLRQQQRNYANRWARRVRPWFRGRRHVLDYGGSTGVVSQILADTAGDVTVADYGDGAETTPDEALATAWGAYDAILCCQTLDHLARPLDTLLTLAQAVRQGTPLFVDVVKQSCTAYKLDHDTYYPTASSFAALIERGGWDLVWLDAETNPSHYSVLAQKR